MAKTHIKSMVENKTNQTKLAVLLKELQGYMTSDQFGNLFLRVAIQGGVIQTIEMIPWDHKKATTSLH